MREACGSPCSALKRPFGTFQCSDRLVAFGDDAGGLRAPRTPRGIKRCRVLLRCAAACPAAGRAFGARSAPKPPFRRTRRRTWGVQCEPQQARGTTPQSGSTPAGSPCSALKRPFGTFQCSDRLITEESPTGASFGKRSISSRLAAFDNAGSLRLPLLRTETPLWDVPVFRSAYWRRKPHRGFLRQTLDLQPLCGLRQCGKPAASLTGEPKEKRDSLQKRESRGENRIS